MTYTPIERGTPDWDVPLNAALASQDARITTNEAGIADINNPQADYGVVGWTFDPLMCSGSTTPGTNGTLYMFKVMVPEPGLVSNIIISSQTAGSGFVANQNFAGLYDENGILLAQSGDLAVLLAGVNRITIPLTAPVGIPAGTYYAGFLFNSTTRPSLVRGGSITALTDVINLNQVSQNYSFSTAGAGMTTLPASVNMATRTSTFAAWWAAVS